MPGSDFLSTKHASHILYLHINKRFSTMLHARYNAMLTASATCNDRQKAIEQK